ncbi:MAG: hypothetical protein IJO14_06810 [Clostridia bacterium]|nr:hypothetical protein [Clostridia bacterium]
MAENILFVFLCIISMSYGWGMRGSILGGEKGAMLPGAFVGLLIARFSGIPALQENWFVLAAAGASGFFFGGCMTYGETLGLTMKGFGTPGFRTGLAGVFVKGFAWFGVAAEIFGIAIVAGGGETYSASDLILTYCATVPAYFIGRTLLNRPHDPKNNVFPKVYFSRTRVEYWGGHLFVFLTFFILNLVRGDWFTAAYAWIVALVAGFGWIFAQIVHVYTLPHMPMKNGKYLFGKLQKNHFVEAWKFMECLIGGFGGLSMSVAFLLLKNLLPYTETSAAYITPFGQHDNRMAIIWTVLFLICALRIIVEPIPKEKKIIEQFSQDKLTKEEYDTAIAKLATPPFLMQYRPLFADIFEGVDFVLLGFLPPLLTMLGSMQTAKLTAVFVLFWVLTEEICFEQFIYRKTRHIFRVVMLGICAALMIGVYLRPSFFSAGFTLLMYAVSYELLQFLWQQRPSIIRTRIQKTGSLKGAVLSFGGQLTMHAFFIPACLLLDIVAVTMI